MWRLPLILLVIGAAVGLRSAAAPAEAGGGCRGEELTDERATAVDMRHSCFFPTVLRVEVGHSVTFTNVDPAAHTVTGAAVSWGDYEEILQGDSVVHTFEEEGVFPYFCLLHPGMVGAIVAGDGGSAGATGASSGSSAVSGVAPVPDRSAGSETAASDSGAGAAPYLLAIGGPLLVIVAGVAAGLVVRRRRAG